MGTEGLDLARAKMVDAGVAPDAIEVFAHYHGQLAAGATGLIAEESIEPLTGLDRAADLAVDPEQARAALDQTVIIKLNGGLGTSMGMDRAKSLLPVRDGQSFLDIIVRQVQAARREHQVRLPLLWMNSFRTRADTLTALERYPDLPVAGLPSDFVQNLEPKLTVDTLAPIEWPADPELEWCPPGHGDVYTALHAAGLIEQLLAAGFRYVSVSNSDNLGAAPDATLAAWFAASGAPFAAEVCRRTRADRKGGHFAVRRSDQRVVLRDRAQVADADLEHFMDRDRHRCFNTNNLWWDLQALNRVLVERDAVLGLPLIRNTKHVDPADPTSPMVHQIETAMGAAIEVFDGATAIEVERSRFLPVKTTNDLLVVRSDVYDIDDDGRLSLTAEAAPFVSLDDDHYKRIGDFEERFAAGVPSLREATSFTVSGDWRFGSGVTVSGDVALDGSGEVPDGARL